MLVFCRSLRVFTGLGIGDSRARLVEVEAGTVRKAVSVSAACAAHGEAELRLDYRPARVAQLDSDCPLREKRRSTTPTGPILSRAGAASDEAEAAVLHR